MKIAILGATSEIAKDLVASFAIQNDHELILFARKPENVQHWLSDINFPTKYSVVEFQKFKSIRDFDAILNFVGAGDPAKIRDSGPSIFETTLAFDDLAISYLGINSNCRYIFMSSGAAYGSNFADPVDENSTSKFPINNIKSQDWYGLAKMYSECRHRALSNLPIVDIRIFNYFSSTQDLTSKYLISEIFEAITSKKIFRTSGENIVRDYLGKNDFNQLITKILLYTPMNVSIDCYSKSPIDKLSLLEVLNKNFGLRYEIQNTNISTHPTGSKLNYYSLNRRAAHFGYEPKQSSLETVLIEGQKYINDVVCSTKA